MHHEPIVVAAFSHDPYDGYAVVAILVYRMACGDEVSRLIRDFARIEMLKSVRDFSRERARARARETDRQTDRQTVRQTDRQTGRQTDRQTETYMQTETDRDRDCGWSLLSHGVAEIKRLDLCNLNPIYERKLNEPDVHQRNVSKSWEGAEDVGIRKRRVASRLSETRRYTR